MPFHTTSTSGNWLSLGEKSQRAIWYPINYHILLRVFNGIFFKKTWALKFDSPCPDPLGKQLVDWLNLALYETTFICFGFGGTLLPGTLGPALVGSELQWSEVRMFLGSGHMNFLSLPTSVWLKIVSQLPPKGFPIIRSDACKSLWRHRERDL